MREPLEPPRWAERLLEWVVPAGVVGESIVGDAREEYSQVAGQHGRRRAAVRYWQNTLRIAWHYGLGRAGGWRGSGGAEGRNGSRGREGGPLSVEHWFRELRQGARRLVRQRVFAVTALATSALAIGASTAIFSVLYGVVLSPLPYPDADDLVLVGHASRTNQLGIPAAAYFHYLDHAHTLASLAIYLESSTSVSGTGAPLEVGIIEATPSLFPVLGVTPALGRGLSADDARPGAPLVAVISHGYWVRQLGSDPDVLGKPILPGEDAVVVGVLPAGFTFPRPQASVVFGNPFQAPDLIMPLRHLTRATGFGNFMYQGVARLAPGATVQAAQRELQGLMLQAAEVYPGGFTPAGLTEGGYHPRVVRFKDALVGDVAQVLWILLGAVGFVFVIAMVNVANLFLLRAESRRGEVAVRLALGASTASLAQAYLAESLLLGCGGGVLGVVLARLATPAVLLLAPNGLPRLDQVGMNLPVLGFAAAVSILVGVVFGTAPLLLTRRVDPGSALREQGRGPASALGGRRLRQAMVVGQVAFAFVLLIGSGLLFRTLHNLRRVDPGFDGTHTLTLRLALSSDLLRDAGYRDGPADALRSRFMLDLTEQLQRLPGVREAAFSADLPLDGVELRDYVAVEGSFPVDLASAQKALREFIGPGYLSSIGAQLVAGRELERSDFASQPRVAVVNESFARQRWPGGDALGRRLTQYYPGLDPSKDIWYTVVGVVRDIRERSLLAATEPTVYLPTVFLPAGDFAMFVSNMVVVVRTAGDPMALLPTIRNEIHRLHPEVPINGEASLSQVVARSFQQVSFAMILILLAACVALLLGVVGVYGSVAYVVAQRRREFGLRLALGASAGRLRREVMTRGIVIGGAGIAFGLLGALLSGQVLTSLLFGVAPTDPVVYLAVSVGLLAVVLVACLGPAGRAARADPVRALRAD